MAAGISRPDVWTGAALNRDPNDPDTPAVWTSLESSTLQVLSVSGQERGRDYELAQPMAADPTVLVRDQNEYLNPDNPDSPYAGQVEPYREVCQQCQWPTTGAGSTGNLINSGTWRGSRVDPYDPTFESYTAGDPAPNWLERVGGITASISTTSPHAGTQSVRYAVTVPGQGVGLGVPVIPGRQYTTSAYVRQDAGNTLRIYVSGVTAVYDPFGRTVSNGWGTPVVGAAYTVVGTASNYSVAPGTATQVNTATATPRIAVQGTFYACGQYVTITAPALATGASYVIGAVSRYADSSNYYRGGIEFKTDGSVAILVEKVVASAVSTVVSTQTTLTYTAGTRFNFALTQLNKFLEAHVWPTDRKESIFYATGFTVDTAFTSDGAIGCYSYRATGNTNTDLAAAFSDYRAFGTVGGSSTTSNGSYQRLSVTYTADTPGRPALADEILLGGTFPLPVLGTWVYVATEGTTTAANVNVDDIQHEQAAAASAFTSTGPNIFPLFRNLIERYPRTWRARGYEGFTALPCVDAQAALNKIFIRNEAVQAILDTQPDFFYPLSDGADTAMFLDQSGNNQVPLVPYVSKFGAGTALEPATAIAIFGQPGATGVHITGVNSGSAGRRPGTALQLNQQLPPAVPPASGWALSFACWATLDTSVVASENPYAALFSVSNVQGGGIVNPSIVLGVYNATTFRLDVSMSVGGSNASMAIGSPFGDGLAHHFACVVKQDATNTTITAWMDGVSTTTTAANAAFGTMVPGRTVTLGADSAGVVQSFLNGTMSNAAIWNREITDAEVQAMRDAGAFGFDGERSGGRVLRHIQTGGYYGPTRIAIGSTDMGVPTFDGQLDLLNDTLNTMAAEMGTFWVQPDGVAAFEGRQDRWLRLDPVAVIGEDQSGGEIPYLDGILFDHDPTYVYPVVTWTRNRGAIALGGLPADRALAARKYFPRQFDGSSDLFEDATAQYLADWIFYSHRAPMTRVDTVEIDPWSNPDLWPLVLRLEAGQRVTVIRRAKSANGGAGLVMSADYFIEKVGFPEINFTQDSQVWTVALQISPIGAGSAPARPTNQPWILEDAVYGVLDETTVLGW